MIKRNPKGERELRDLVDSDLQDGTTAPEADGVNGATSVNALISGITSSNLHAEVDFGRALGRELCPPYEGRHVQRREHPAAE